MNKLKLSPKTFYECHTNEINKYKNLDTKTLHVVYKNIEYRGLGDNEEILNLSVDDDLSTTFNSLENNCYDLIVVTDIFDISYDVMGLILKLEKICNDNGQIIFSNLNSKWHPVFKLFELLRLKKPSPRRNRISPKKLISVAKGADLELINCYSRLFIPFNFFGIGLIINKILELVFFKFNLGMKFYSVFRKSNLKYVKKSKTLIIPAKNEEGNLEELISRINLDHKSLQVIFCIGKSKDNTLQKARELTKTYKDINFHLFEQSTNGKGPGVFESFEYVENELVAILDSDLSVDPEELNNIFKIIESGTADFVNCTRLIYKMEKGAMRKLNSFMNSFFPIIISLITNIRFTDTLCGTKVFDKKFISKINTWKKMQKNLDPFGDFDMLFSAVYFSEKVAEYPIRYKSRKYGTTQINRFRDGFRLIIYLIFSIYNLNVSKT